MHPVLAAALYCHCGHSRGGGLGTYLVMRWLFHVIGWWALIPVGIIVVLGAWCSTSSPNSDCN